MDDEIKKLIADYSKEYSEGKHPFLLFELAHAKENDHTRVLKSILVFNNFQFLPSFLERIDAPDIDGVTSIKISDQEKAVGTKKKGYGFVDLYLEYQSKDEKVKIIIENKICGACDTDHQLARYIATACKEKITDDEFNKIWGCWENANNSSEIKEEDLEHIHVVYLTSDGNKTPEENSLPKYFTGDNWDGQSCNYINYHALNYLYDIIPWLEDDVLPNVPYSDDGIMIAGIRQYIASLKAEYNPVKSSRIIEGYVKKLKGSSFEKYNEIEKTINRILENSAEYDFIGKMVSELGEYKKFLFSDMSPEEWELYFTPSFILMYKNSWWSEYDKKKGYNFPSIHMFCSPTNNFIQKKGKLTWSIKAVRIPNSEIKTGSSYKDGWELKGRDLVLKFNYNGFAKVCKDEYFKNIIKNEIVKNAIDFIDGIIEKASKDDLYQSKVVDELCKMSGIK